MCTRIEALQSRFEADQTSTETAVDVEFRVATDINLFS